MQLAREPVSGAQQEPVIAPPVSRQVLCIITLRAAQEDGIAKSAARYPVGSTGVLEQEKVGIVRGKVPDRLRADLISGHLGQLVERSRQPQVEHGLQTTANLFLRQILARRCANGETAYRVSVDAIRSFNAGALLTAIELPDQRQAAGNGIHHGISLLA